MIDYVDIKSLILKPIVSMVLCLIIALLLIWQLISFVVDLSSLATSLKQQPNITRAKLPNNKSKIITQELVVPIFGGYVPKNLGEMDVKHSDLSLKVEGILFSKQADESQVIIQGFSGKEETYKLGDKLPGGAIIKRITVDGILIERNGVFESLSLPKNELLFAPPVKILDGVR